MPKKKTDHKQKIVIDPHSIICKPLDSYNEILLFLENPPPWRSLCKPMKPHSTSVIRNLELNKHHLYRTLDTPEIFCHFDPDMDEVKRYHPQSLRKTLVCHDMANGYHDDCVVDGTSNSDAYTFYNWAGIDIFCYFSHHLITIPPVGWINSGHAHGVKVIGTLITEWADGITFWEQVLTSETEYQNLANALVAIAKTLNFDGYLLNIENKISKPDVLLEFVRYFHRLLHEELEHATLIWYDSVTIQGNLNWQNKLNEKNKAFFDACDGFFTNYSWTVEDVSSSADLAEERVTDLFIGMDVWGRNFFGGGQFNTLEAVKVAHSVGCSLAIFAPGWTHEALSSDKNDANYVAMADDLDDYGQFLLRDRAFWGSIWPFLNTRVPCEMPFQTSFCRGQGKKRRLYGEVLSPSPWFNLRHQQYQPNAAHGPHGYLLSTADKIIKVSRTAQYKDKKGIMRYRSSFQFTRNELHAVARDAAPDVRSIDSMEHHDGSAHSIDTSDNSIVKPDDAVAAGETQKLVKKTKMKDAFINLFKQKGPKTSDDESGSPSIPGEANIATATVSVQPQAEEVLLQPEAEDAALQPQAETVALGELAGPSQSKEHTSASKSMMQMSVSLRLGTSTEKTRFYLAHVSEERECLQLYLHDSFTGGGCLKVNPSDKLCPEHRFTRLFFCDFYCQESLIICVVTKHVKGYSEQSLNVNLFMKNARDEELRVVLTGRDLAPSKRLDGAAAGIKYVNPLATAAPAVLRELRTYLLLAQPDFYVPIDNCFGWIVRYYEVSVPGARVTSVNVRTGLPQGGILLGHFGICNKLTEDPYQP